MKTNVIASTGEETPLDLEISSLRTFDREIMHYN